LHLSKILSTLGNPALVGDVSGVLFRKIILNRLFPDDITQILGTTTEKLLSRPSLETSPECSTSSEGFS